MLDYWGAGADVQPVCPILQTSLNQPIRYGYPKTVFSYDPTGTAHLFFTTITFLITTLFDATY